MFDELRHPAHAEPAHHRARNFIPDQITKDRWMAGIFGNAFSDRINDRVACRFLAQKFDMLRPRQRDKNAHPDARTPIEKPQRRDVVNTNDVDSELAHLGEIPICLIWWPKIVSGSVRFEWPVGYALDEELAFAFEEKFCDRTDRARTHSGSS